MTVLRVPAENPAAPPVSAAPPLSSYLRAYVSRVRGGDMGAVPAVLGLIVLGITFSVARPTFFTTGNFANLMGQAAAVTIIAMGLVFVLLLGEIDLSAGFTSGVCAAVLATTLAERHFPWWEAVLASTATGVLIGLVLGWLVAKVGIPSFVVTLAAFLAFQGVMLLIIHEGKNITVADSTILAIGNNNMSPMLGWLFYALLVIGYAAIQFTRISSRRRRGLASDAVSVAVFRVATLAIIGGLSVYALNLERSRNPAFNSLRGIPIVVPLIAALLIVLTFVLRRTRYGLHIYAVGGNLEAARRAGINTDRIRISAFLVCSTLASIGGLVAASRAASVDPNTGGNRVLLYAVGAAVIGGTSLFGGKGRVLDAVLGGLVVAVIENGMGLMGYTASQKLIITGSVLLLAAGVDALSRRRAAAVGLR